MRERQMGPPAFLKENPFRLLCKKKQWASKTFQKNIPKRDFATQKPHFANRQRTEVISVGSEKTYVSRNFSCTGQSPLKKKKPLLPKDVKKSLGGDRKRRVITAQILYPLGSEWKKGGSKRKVRWWGGRVGGLSRGGGLKLCLPSAVSFLAYRKPEKRRQKKNERMTWPKIQRTIRKV